MAAVSVLEKDADAWELPCLCCPLCETGEMRVVQVLIRPRNGSRLRPGMAQVLAFDTS